MNSKHKLGTSIFLCSLALIGVTVSAAVMTANKKSALNANGVFGDTSDYTVVLDETNAYTSGSTKEVTTSSGSWQISFAYSNASALSGGHVTLANGGTLVNTRDIISIDYLKVHCSGTGTLQFRTSYDGATWGGYADIKDNEVYNLGSLPYYVELSATGGSVNIYQATYQYTCNPNPNAQGTEVVTEEEVELLFMIKIDNVEISIYEPYILYNNKYYSNYSGLDFIDNYNSGNVDKTSTSTGWLPFI